MTSNSSRILLVEDDPEQALLFSMILTTNGYTVTTAPTAEAALELLAHTSFALLLVDLDLPGMKGDTLIATVKAQNLAIPALLYSNHLHVNKAALACGADGWFRKMDDTSYLLQLIADVLRKNE